MAKTNITHNTHDLHTKKKCNREAASEGSIGKLLDNLNQFLFEENLILNSDAAPNYTYMIGPHKCPLPCIWNVHYEYKPIQIYWKFNHQKMKTFR